MKYANREWQYEFMKIPELCSENDVEKATLNLFEKFAPLTKEWNKERNSEWVIRVFYSVKMIFSASVMAQSLEFATSKNLRFVESYLEYYIVMHSLRAILFTSPHVEWNDGEILKTTHSKTINVGCNQIARFDVNLSKQIKQAVKYLKAFREYISYHAPSSGGKFPKLNFDIYGYSRLIFEIAQMQSELLEASIDKHASDLPEFNLDEKTLEHVIDVNIDGFNFSDDEDYYRIGYLARKYPKPTSIFLMMSEGWVEDFFDSWCTEQEEPDAFDPDGNWQILFDVP